MALGETPHIEKASPRRKLGDHTLRGMTVPPVVLLIDDSEDDVLLACEAFERAGLSAPLYVLHTGEEAIQYLRGEGRYANRAEHPLPDLILLDLNMPRIGGLEVLRWIRQQPGIRGIPVVVLSGSQQMADVSRAYALGANSFLVKPLDFRNYIVLSTLICHYWMQTVKMPETFRPVPALTL